MWTRQHRQRHTGRLIVPALAIAFLSYFGFHAYHGGFGIYAKERLEVRLGELQGDLLAVQARRSEIEERVRLLRDGSIEKDMLDEHARRALNLAHKDEIVVYLPPGAAN